MLSRWCQGLRTMWRQQVVWMSVPETLGHENRNSEVKRFLKLIMSWPRKPRNERRRRSGTDHGTDTKEHEELCRTHEPYRAWCHACIAHRGRNDPHAMRTSLRKACLWSESTAGTCGADVEAEDDDGDPPDCVRTTSPVLCG